VASLLPRCKRKPKIQAALPSLQDARMQALLICRVVGVATQSLHGRKRCFNRTAVRRNLHLVVCRGYAPSHGFAVL
jgi:hypothetical protein